jgi:hypothetical protein
MFIYQRPQPIQFVRAKATRLSKTYWVKPILGNIFAVFNMNMRRLGPLKTVEKEPISFEPQHGWHLSALTPSDPTPHSHIQ